MLVIAEKYKKPVDDIHRIFFEVGCDTAQLIESLQGCDELRWTALEDIALHEGPESETYQYLVDTRGVEEVEKRLEFLYQN